MRQLIDKKIKIFFYLFLFILLSTPINKKNIFKDSFENNINIIEITGLSEKNNNEVYDSLKFLLKQNILLLNGDDVLNILKQNHLIENFYIKKIYPNLIKIKIKQADLLAITNLGSKKFYIGSNGKLIPLSKIEVPNYNLPFVYGKNSYINFLELKKFVDKSNIEFKEIESFYYFPSNRWDIKTKDGFLIKLPEENILESLKFANRIKKNNELNKKKIIDLRINKKIILSNE
tara:strand:- start:834 stop:1529 length:696 start_codon:yes stop_codon:yes gene_type:complete